MYTKGLKGGAVGRVPDGVGELQSRHFGGREFSILMDKGVVRSGAAGSEAPVSEKAI